MRETTKRAIKGLVQDQAVRAHVRGMQRYQCRRVVTPSQEIAYRLCHHDFCGLKQEDAAEVMGVIQQVISEHLLKLRNKAPQLFPVLKPRIAKMYELFMEGFTCEEIADLLDVTPRAVQMVLKQLMEDGQLFFCSGSVRRLSYQPWQDEYIVEKF